MVRALWTIAALAAAPGVPAHAQSLPFTTTELSISSPAEATLTLKDARAIDGRCEIAASIDTADLRARLDALGREQGNIGSRRNRLYRTGPTRLRAVEPGGVIRLTSRARHESGACAETPFGTIKNKDFRDTKTADLRLDIRWLEESKELALAYEAENSGNGPGDAEKRAKRLGARFGGETAFPIPQAPIAERLDPRIVAGPTVSAANAGDGPALAATRSIRLPTLQCRLAQKATRTPAFGTWLILPVIEELGA